jgi:transposase-like protein
MSIQAHHIIELLRKRHTEDLFVDECKDGSTWNRNNHLKLDAWAMNRSWSNMLMTGYEVKVSRQDFLRDQKWEAYLPFCHRFYFVAPPGIINPMELPPEVGLLMTSVNGARLFEKKRAVRREIELPVPLLLYVLMSRSKIARSTGFSTIEYWREWLAEKEQTHTLGRSVSKRLGQLMGERIHKVEEESRRIKNENEQLEAIKVILEKLGIDITKLSRWNLESQINRALQAIPEDIYDRLWGASEDLAKALAAIESLYPKNKLLELSNHK